MGWIYRQTNFSSCFRLTASRPDSVGVLGNCPRKLFILSEETGTKICLPVNPAHLDVGSIIIFWKLIFFATKDASNDVRSLASDSSLVSLIWSPFITEFDGSLPFSK